MMKDWKYEKLGNVCKTVAGGTPLKSHKEYYENGTIPWIRSGEVNNRNIVESELKITQQGLENSSAKLFPPETVVIAMYGATAGQVGILNFECATNQAVCGILPKKNFVPEFLYYFFLKYKDELIAQAVGNAQPNISQAKIRNTLIPIISVDEQKQIVAILDKAFAAIDQAQANIRQNIENAKELFQSKLNDIFSQKGNGWEEKTLGEVCKYDKTKYATSNRPYVGLEHIKSNTGKFIGGLEPFDVKSSTFQFDERHVLYGRLRPYLNKVFVPYFKGHCSTEIFPILTDDSINREYLFYWFLTPKTVSKIDATWTGARMPRANMNEVIKFQLFIPKIEVQQQVVNQLNDIKTETEAIESHYRQKLDNLEDLKKSILQKAFSGELTKNPVAV